MADQVRPFTNHPATAPSNGVTRLLLPGLLAIGVSCWIPAAAAAEFTRVRVGHQGVGRIADWLPVRVEAQELTPGDPLALEVTTLDARGHRVVERSGAATVESDGTMQVSGLCRVGRLDDFVQVALVAEDGTTACSTTIACGIEPRSQPPDAVQKYLRVHRFEVPFLLTIGDTAGIPELLERERCGFRATDAGWTVGGIGR